MKFWVLFAIPFKYALSEDIKISCVDSQQRSVKAEIYIDSHLLTNVSISQPAHQKIEVRGIATEEIKTLSSLPLAPKGEHPRIEGEYLSYVLRSSQGSYHVLFEYGIPEKITFKTDKLPFEWIECKNQKISL